MIFDILIDLCKCCIHNSNYITSTLSTSFTKGESTLPNIKHFGKEFDVHDVNSDAQQVVSLVLQS